MLFLFYAKLNNPSRFVSFNSRLNLDFELIFQSFGNLHIVLFIWLIMQLCTAIVVFMGFHYWANHRIDYYKNAKTLRKNIQINRQSFFMSYSFRNLWFNMARYLYQLHSLILSITMSWNRDTSITNGFITYCLTWTGERIMKTNIDNDYFSSFGKSWKHIHLFVKISKKLIHDVVQ